MSYTHITEKERYVISHMKIAGFSLRAIGRRLGRDHTSIMREIDRNRPTYADDAVYWYYATQKIAVERLHKARGGKWGRASKLISWLLAAEVRSCNIASFLKPRNPRSTHHHLIPKADLRFIPHISNHNHRPTGDSLIFPLNTV